MQKSQPRVLPPHAEVYVRGNKLVPLLSRKLCNWRIEQEPERQLCESGFAKEESGDTFPCGESENCMKVLWRRPNVRTLTTPPGHLCSDKGSLSFSRQVGNSGAKAAPHPRHTHCLAADPVVTPLH